MGVVYIPVVEEHKCTLPTVNKSFQVGAGAPSWDQQIQAGIFYECDGCSVLWVLTRDSDTFAEYEWVWVFPLVISPSFRKWKKAKKNGTLARREDDHIVKELSRKSL